MRLTVFGLSITSSWGNGHATVYRGLLRELHQRGVEITFVEKDSPWYAANRDLPQPDFARVLLYGESDQLDAVLDDQLGRADIVLLGSYFPDGIKVADRLATIRGPVRLYYDIDTPVTLAAFARDGGAPYLQTDQVALFDAVLSFTGGRALRELEERWGARRAVPFYCALAPDFHRRTEPTDRFRCRLGYMGTYSDDRQQMFESLFLGPARRLSEQQFVLAGPQYPAMELPSNVRHYQHVAPPEHSTFYSSCDLTLNLTRGPMVAYGHSPSVRLFEAGGCAACVISDPWDGLGELFQIGQEILVASNEEEMTELLQRLEPAEVADIGRRFHARVMLQHSYATRAQLLLELITRL